MVISKSTLFSRYGIKWIVTSLLLVQKNSDHVLSFAIPSSAKDNFSGEHNDQNTELSKTLSITFVTGNDMKVKEVDNILSEFAATHALDPKSFVTLRTLKIDLPELQEIDTMAIAKNKALLAAQLANGPCLVEDTSLHFHALGGMPGPYIKWFQDKLKSGGLYNILAAYEDKTATAVCTLAFSPAPHADPILFTGECRGQIVPPEPGKHGFGWDSIFVPDQEYRNNNNTITNNGLHRSFSQMTITEKSELSHRGKAVRKLAAWLERNRDALYRRQQGEPAIGHQGLKFVDKPINEVDIQKRPKSAEDSYPRVSIPLDFNDELK